MSYTRTNWEDLPSTNTPINATNLNNIEDGIEDIDDRVTDNEQDIIQINNMLDIFEGTATVNNTYISSVENNHYEKYGRVVSYSFTMTVKGSWSTTTQFLSGLPEAKRYTRFIGYNTSNQTVMRFAIEGNGDITNAYSFITPASGHVIEGHVTYIAKE